MIKLGELLRGNQKQQGMMDMSKHMDVFGEDIPDIELNSVGKFRLMQMLRHRFGANYKSFPKAREIVGQFEKEMKLHVLQSKMMRMRNANSR